MNQHLPLRLRYLLIGLILSFTNGDRDVKKTLVVLFVSLFSLTAIVQTNHAQVRKVEYRIARVKRMMELSASLRRFARNSCL